MGVNGYVTGLCERGLKIAKFKPQIPKKLQQSSIVVCLQMHVKALHLVE